MKTLRKPIDGFRGLNNVADPLSLDLSWLARADNCVVNNHRKLVRAHGFEQRDTATSITGSYATEDQQQLYLVDAGQLVQLETGFVRRVLATGLSSAPMYFVEVNGLVYYTNGIDRGMIQDGRAQAWGIEPPGVPQLTVGTGVLPAGTYQACITLTDARGIESGNGQVAMIVVGAGSQITVSEIPQTAGLTSNVYVTAANGSTFYQLTENAGTAVSYNCAPDALGMELPFWRISAPRGTLPAIYAGQMWIAEPVPAADMSVIWPSLPIHYHHFSLGAGAITVPGSVRLLKGFDDGLLIGTDRTIFLWTGEALLILARYGVTPGVHADVFNKQTYFWTLRGMCRAMPFENMTQGVVSVAPGVSAGGAVIEQDGFRRYVACLQIGGQVYNTRVPVALHGDLSAELPVPTIVASGA